MNDRAEGIWRHLFYCAISDLSVRLDAAEDIETGITPRVQHPDQLFRDLA